MHCNSNMHPTNYGLLMFPTSQTWGIAIAGVILQNQLKGKLPEAFMSKFPAGVDVYAVVPVIRYLEPESLRNEVQVAFAESLATVYKVMVGISGLGFLTVFCIKEVPMSTITDEKYGLESATSSLPEVVQGERKV